MADFSADGLAKKVEDLWESFGHIKYGRKDSASRAFTFGSQFTLGTMAINAAQFLGAPLALINEDWHNDWIKFNKQQWGLLITTMTHWWSPTLVRVSGDKSVRGQLSQTADGQLVCNFSERMMLIANHQIYTDWLYLWYVGYANGLHGQIHVVMKESLKKLPFVGWGMSLSKFIFLKRNWEQDKAGLANHLQTLNKPDEPMWLMFFPEGTNLAPSTREKSKDWADKNGIKDFQHVLLPRSTGLHFCLLKLRETVDYVYDCTIAYEGVPRGEYAQDIFTLQSAWISGKPPKSVNMHWRRFKISAIPLHDLKQFDIWLRARWAEKDTLIEHYMRTGRFPADTGFDNQGEGGQIREGAGHIETQVKPNKWYEILQVFAPIASIAIVLYYFYNKTLPSQMFDQATDWAGMSEDEIKKLLRVGPAPKLGKPKTVSSQALKNTLKPPNLQEMTSPAIQPPSTRRQSQATSTMLSTTYTKPASTYAGSVNDPSRKERPSLPAAIPKLHTTSASTKASTSKAPPPQTVAPQKAAPQKVAPQKIAPRKAAPQKVAPQKVAPQKVAPQKVAPQKTAQQSSNVIAKSEKEPIKEAHKEKASLEKALVAKTPGKASTNTKASVKNTPAKDVSTTTPKKKVTAPTTQKKAVSADKSPPSQPTKRPTTSTATKNNTPVKEAPITKPQPKTAPPTASKKDVPVADSQRKATTRPAQAKPKPLPKTSPKTANAQGNQTTITKTKLPATKAVPTPTSKVPLKQEGSSSKPTVPPSQPRRLSAQTKVGAWSETTAVDDPWSERPSGKRLIKSQPTRKDRIKLEKKQQRQHLDHLTN